MTSIQAEVTFAQAIMTSVQAEVTFIQAEVSFAEAVVISVQAIVTCVQAEVRVAKGFAASIKVNSDLAPVYSLRFCPAHEWNSGLALRSPLKRTEPQTLSQSL